MYIIWHRKLEYKTAHVIFVLMHLRLTESFVRLYWHDSGTQKRWPMDD